MPSAFTGTFQATQEAPQEYFGGETLAANDPSGPTALTVPQLDQGMLVGRYVLLARLGSGAMGVVFAAYDPQLDRKIAIKLLKPGPGNPASSRARLQREARALAKLNHANVVAVHDVGVHRQQVFVAMEFVEGTTLTQWMNSDDERPQPWRAVVRMFEAAGRGLAAAHEQGLVHRDFKPDNIMLGADGRIRVMDFGVAGGLDEQTQTEEKLADLELDHEEAVDQRLTRTGAMLGTPAYMAPEQMGGTATASSDQFGFCVALYEALYGVRPFEGSTVATLLYAITDGRIRVPPRHGTVPTWLHQIVVRGLSAEPKDRFGSMSELLDALNAAEVRRRRVRWGTLVLGAGVALAGVKGYQHLDHARRVEACAAYGDTIDEIWNPEVRDATAEGLMATGVSYAPRVAEESSRWLERHAESWRLHATTACTNATVDQTWSEDTLERSQWCLEARRSRFSMLVEELAKSDRRSVRVAVEAAAQLPRVEPCTDERSLASMAEPPPPSIRPRVAEQRKSLARARAQEDAAQYAAGLDTARAVVQQSTELSWPPLTAAAQATESALLLRLGEYAEAETAGVDAYMLASRSGAWDIAADVASSLVYIVGYRQGRYDDGEMWARHAEIAITHGGDPLGLRESNRAGNLAVVLHQRGDDERAMALYERSIAVRERVLGPEHPTVAKSLANIGMLYKREGQFAEAKARLEQALAMQIASQGSGHPAIATTRKNIGNLLFAMGQHSGAIAQFEQALEIEQESLGPEHPALAQTLTQLGDTHQRLGNLSESERLLEHAVEIRISALGPEHHLVADSLNGLGNVQRAMGRLDAAKDNLGRALAIQERRLGPEDPIIALMLNNLANAYVSAEEYAQAEAFMERAVAIQTAVSGTEHLDTAQVMYGLAAVYDLAGRHDDARKLFEQSLAIIRTQGTPKDQAYTETGLGGALRHLGQFQDALDHLEHAVVAHRVEPVDPHALATAQFILAQTLWDAPVETGRDRKRAIELAQESRQRLSSMPMPTDLVDAWLAERDPSTNADGQD